MSELADRIEAAELVALVNQKADEARPDDFAGDNAHLVRCIWAFLDLTDQKAFVPFNIPKGSHAYRLLNAAAHRLAALRAQGWQPIETAPRERSLELLGAWRLQGLTGMPWVVRSIKWHATSFRQKSEERWTQTGGPECRPTHWMPLPPPPAPEGDA